MVFYLTLQFRSPAKKLDCLYFLLINKTSIIKKSKVKDDIIYCNKINDKLNNFNLDVTFYTNLYNRCKHLQLESKTRTFNSKGF